MEAEELWTNERILKEWSQVQQGENLDRQGIALLKKIRDELQNQIDVLQIRCTTYERQSRERHFISQQQSVR